MTDRVRAKTGGNVTEITTKIGDCGNRWLFRLTRVSPEEFLGRIVCTSVSNVSREISETDANCEKAFANVPDVLKQYRDRYRDLLEKPVH